MFVYEPISERENKIPDKYFCQHFEKSFYKTVHFLSFSLCRAPSNRVHGAPFRPVRAMAVDLFPQTMHVEILLLLERVDYKSQQQQTSSTQEETGS